MEKIIIADVYVWIYIGPMEGLNEKKAQGHIIQN